MDRETTTSTSTLDLDPCDSVRSERERRQGFAAAGSLEVRWRPRLPTWQPRVMSLSSPDDLRDCFDQATRRHLVGTLVPGVELRTATTEEHEAHQDALWTSATDRRPPDSRQLFSDADRARVRALDRLRGGCLEHRLLWCAGDEVIGAYRGTQEDGGSYLMWNTVVRRDFQRRGLYRAFLPRLIAAVREVGFRQIHSRHHADNNAVLVSKLKAGFVISGFEISPRDGVLIDLRLFLHDGLGKLFAHIVDGSYAAELRAAGVALP